MNQPNCNQTKNFLEQKNINKNLTKTKLKLNQPQNTEKLILQTSLNDKEVLNNLELSMISNMTSSMIQGLFKFKLKKKYKNF